jgi:homoserine trans-succinylase
MKKINLGTAVSIAEIISSFAIVASLVYVGYEFKRSETLTNRDADDIIYGKISDINHLIIETPDLAEIILKTKSSPSQLSAQDSLRYLAFEHLFYDSWESAWNYYNEGVLDKEIWESWDKWFKSEAKRRSLLAWEGNRKHFSGNFLNYVDNLLIE